MASTDKDARVLWWVEWWDWGLVQEDDSGFPPPEVQKVSSSEQEVRSLAESAATNHSGFAAWWEHLMLVCRPGAADGRLTIERKHHVVPWRRPYQGELRGWYELALREGHEVLVVEAVGTASVSHNVPHFVTRQTPISLHSSSLHEAFDVSAACLDAHTAPQAARFRHHHRSP